MAFQLHCHANPNAGPERQRAGTDEPARASRRQHARQRLNTAGETDKPGMAAPLWHASQRHNTAGETDEIGKAGPW